MPHSIDHNEEKCSAEANEEGSQPMANCIANNNHRSNSNNASGEYEGSCSSGGGGSSISSGGSDDDDEDSLDSSCQSDKNGHLSPSHHTDSQPATNGIEVKPCRTVVEDGTLSLTTENKEPTGEGAFGRDSDGDVGGRLRFYLDGRCVLELRHDNNEGQAKQWVQSFGKTYRPPVSTVTTPCASAWKPQEPSSNQEVSEEVAPTNTQKLSSLTPHKKKSYSNFCITFFARNGRRTSHETDANTSIRAACILRKTARRPCQIFFNDLCCSHGKRCERRQWLRKRFPSTLIEKSQRLNSVIDQLLLANGCLSASKNEKGRCSPESLQLKSLTKGISLLTQDVPNENEKGEMHRPLPEWYFDPSKATIPVDEMIGYPRPSLMSSQKTLNSSGNNNNKRSMDEVDLKSPEAKKQVKEDIEALEKDAKNYAHSSQHPKSPSSSHMNCVSATVSVNAATENAANGCVTVAAEEVTATGKPGERKKKKGGGGYGRGRTIGEAVRTYVISEILNLGGDVRTNYVPRGVFTEVASRYRIDATTTYRWWLKYSNGVRMAASGNLNLPDASHKGFVPKQVPAALQVMRAPDQKARSHQYHKDVKSLHRSHFLESSMLKRDHLSLMAASGINLQHGGGRYSPRSDDSASSGASLVDPASLYVSSFNIAPHADVCPTSSSSSQASFQTGRVMPIPLGVCVPYLWNNSTERSRLNGFSADDKSRIESKASSAVNSDEPLDLSVPKKVLTEGSKGQCSKMENLKVLSTGLGTCPSEQLILRTLLSSQGKSTAGSTTSTTTTTNHNTSSGSRVEKEERYSIGKPFAKSLAQRNMKPKHYPFLSLQIGSFEIHSNLDSKSCERGNFKEIPNKFKVIFTQRKFVYEFETNAEMELPLEESNQNECAKRMACIVVPFNIVEAFWCYGSTIVLRVVSKPFMFLGRKLKQVGCVPSLTVYETKKSVDLTGGQLSMAHLHKVTLIKPHLIEQLKIYLVLFDVRFRNLISPIAHSLVSAEERRVDHPD